MSGNSLGEGKYHIYGSENVTASDKLSMISYYSPIHSKALKAKINKIKAKT